MEDAKKEAKGARAMDEQDDEDPISGAVVWLLKILFVVGGVFVVAAMLAGVGA